MTTSVTNISGASRDVRLSDGTLVTVAAGASYGFPDAVAGHVPNLPGDLGAGLLAQTSVWQPGGSATNVSLVVQVNGNNSLTVNVSGAQLYSDSGHTTPVTFPRTITTDTTYYAAVYGVQPLTVSLKDSLGYEHWLAGTANLDPNNPTTTVQAGAPLGGGNYLPFLTTSAWTSGNLAIGVNTVDATAGNKTPALPTPTAVGQLLSVEKTDSTSNTVTISGTIRGTSTSVALVYQYESIVFEAESLSSWRPIAGHKTLAQLNGTFVATLNAGLIGWTLAQAFRVSSASRDSNGAITTASVVWPDGSTGTFTTDTASTAFPGAIDAYHVTYVNAGLSISKTVTQTAVTRDGNGAVTAQPALTVA